MIFRAKRKDNGKLVYGSLTICNAFDLKDGTHPAQPLRAIICKQDIEWVSEPDNKRWTFLSYEILPETLAMETTIKDKNDKMIFGSIHIDGKMSTGGDKCKCHVFTQELGENMGVYEGEKEFICRIEFGPAGVCLKGENEENSGPIFAYGGFHEDSLEIIDPDNPPAEQVPDGDGKG